MKFPLRFRPWKLRKLNLTKLRQSEGAFVFDQNIYLCLKIFIFAIVNMSLKMIKPIQYENRRQSFNLSPSN